MVKTKLSMEQIVAGALLLDFDNVSSVDISLLAEDFLKKNPSYSLDAEKTGYINKYIKTENGNITLKDGLNMDSYIPENESNLRKRLEQIAGARIRKYLETFNIEGFMLRKIKYYSRLQVDIIDGLLCKKQQEELNKIDDKGYLTTFWEEDIIYDDSKVIALSDYGKIRLFKIDYAEEIESFIKKLKYLRYDVSLLDDFLLKQDLELPVWNVLNIENLEQFCNDYDRAITDPSALGVYFKGLEKALNEGCYIKVFSCSLRYPVVRVEKKNKETKEEELISYAENGNVISALNSASNKIIDELSERENYSERVWCDSISIDRVVEQGYTLHFFKLSNGQVLSTICGGGYGNYIPVKSIIANDIQTGFATLIATLENFNFDKTHDFDSFAESQISPVCEYQKKLTQDKSK